MRSDEAGAITNQHYVAERRLDLNDRHLNAQEAAPQPRAWFDNPENPATALYLERLSELRPGRAGELQSTS